MKTFELFYKILHHHKNQPILAAAVPGCSTRACNKSKMAFGRHLENQIIAIFRNDFANLKKKQILAWYLTGDTIRYEMLF